ncbi:MAG: beta-lactamase family protein [Anaerolineaceae bacterium]|nr:beta-lactamase family protein [Anaerolineaceae bacterium]
MKYIRQSVKLLFILGLLSSLFVPSYFGAAKGNNQIDLQAVDSFLQKQVKSNRIPGLAVAIVQSEKVIFNKGYGKAAPGEPVTPQTQFYIGSVTKSFTALATMQLVEQGKLDLDAPVQQYLPWFQIADSEASSKITVRHLLNHTSGLSEAGDPHPSKYTSNLEDQARALTDVHLTESVGSQYQYYNQNYRVVGLLIEQVSGQSFGDYLQENVFEPLGMAHTIADPTEATKLAQGYSRVFGFSLPQSQRFVPGGLPSGYLISTADDMAQYLLAQIKNQQVDGKQMLTPQSLTTMRTPPIGIDSEYGMGWMVLENGNSFAHGGALEYFQSFVTINLKEEVGLVILFNQNSLENMLFENNVIRNGLINLLNGTQPQKITYGWTGWLLLILATSDLFNHLRLFRMLPVWVQKTSSQNNLWLWTKVLAGILFPLAVIFGLPLLVNAIGVGTPSWSEPLKLMPDLTIWLLLGLILNLIRSLLHALKLLRRQER